ncbi:MAG: hypothetical protein SPI12_07210 [Actinomycetaceae bacterium]|nr:hypothetical protein [Actinomycetaceae bacterium]MDY6083624.1 hypothetical protein [Actinomycetaceae bacterium]
MAEHNASEGRKIIAVIPARAGSKGVPNKNIRLLDGKPLVYYSIRNALDSALITDVVVSTDSRAVEGIARTMGASVHWRDEALTRDDVALDAVIYDAVSALDCDMVVTLQPTSPTLQASTLDAAIEHAIRTDADTVISVVNHPHLAWTLSEEGKPTPAYKERLNRQYLPPYFMETGAFVISKRSAVTPQGRIGRDIELYPLSESEAIDIDTFSDLITAEHELSKEKVAFYVNGNNRRGIGHVYRALELADEFYDKPDIYFDVNQTNREVFGSTTHNLIPVDGLHDLFAQLQAQPYTLIINDILQTTADYMLTLRKIVPDAHIVNFEDDGEGSEYADLVFNALYNTNYGANIKAGEKYYISSKSFLFYPEISVNDQVKNCFISFGGADPQNYTDRLLALVTGSLADVAAPYHFYVALGRAKQNVDELLTYNSYPNIDVVYDVENMPELMSRCDVGVTSRGRTGYELAILGIPSIAMAQNAREEKHGFVSRENGFDYLGLNPSDEAIAAALERLLTLSETERRQIQQTLLSHDLRHGRQRVMNLIHSL